MQTDVGDRPALHADEGKRPVQHRRRVGVGPVVVVAVVGLILLARIVLAAQLRSGRVRTWSTVFMAIATQALPFLVLGVVVSGAISALIPVGAIERLLPRNRAAAVCVSAAAGAALPGCECASVPVAGRLVSRGVAPSAALTFLLAAPAINPVVLVATAVAFPGQPRVVLARFVGSLLVSIVVGWIWLAIGRDEWVARARRPTPESMSRWDGFRSTAVHDMVHAGGYLMIGAAMAATLQVFVAKNLLGAVASRGVVAVVAVGVLAVVTAVCSEADAFVAKSLTQFPLSARLAFMVVGPAVDVKLIAMQIGTFGRSFSARFAPLTFVVAVLSALVVGRVLL